MPGRVILVTSGAILVVLSGVAFFSEHSAGFLVLFVLGVLFMYAGATVPRY